jgi:hypothetical protein
MSENDTEKGRSDVDTSWERGYWDGLETTKPPPAWYFSKTLYMLKPFEAGWYFGWQMRLRVPDDTHAGD